MNCSSSRCFLVSMVPILSPVPPPDLRGESAPAGAGVDAEQSKNCAHVLVWFVWKSQASLDFPTRIVRRHWARGTSPASGEPNHLDFGPSLEGGRIRRTDYQPARARERRKHGAVLLAEGGCDEAGRVLDDRRAQIILPQVIGGQIDREPRLHDMRTDLGLAQ